MRRDDGLEDEISDGELLRRAAAGDERATRALVDRYIRRAVLLAVQVLGDRDAAEDVAQDAFLVALRRAADFDMTATFAPWFFGIVRRLAQKTRSRERRRWHLLERWHARDSAALGEVASANLQFEDVRSAIRDLPPMQRACCELAFVHGIAPEQIAAMHDISPSTVRQHIFRGRQRLRALLSEHRGEENQR